MINYYEEGWESDEPLYAVAGAKTGVKQEIPDPPETSKTPQPPGFEGTNPPEPRDKTLDPHIKLAFQLKQKASEQHITSITDYLIQNADLAAIRDT